jgi:hypothetical protein
MVSNQTTSFSVSVSGSSAAPSASISIETSGAALARSASTALSTRCRSSATNARSGAGSSDWNRLDSGARSFIQHALDQRRGRRRAPGK